MIKPLSNILLLTTILAFLSSCNGQNVTRPIPANYSVALGDTVTSIADTVWVVYQDKKNNYWFGSVGHGVYKYNGKTLLNYTTQHGLSSNNISEIKEDQAGNIIIGTAGGINKFDGKTITILSPEATNGEWESGPNDLWFKSPLDGSPSRYDGKKLHQLTFPKNEKEVPQPSNVPISPYGIYTTYIDSKGRVWFGTAVLGVGCYDGREFTWITEDDLTELHNGPANGVRSVLEDKNGDFWFNTFYRYSISQNPTGGITYKKNKGIAFPAEFKTDGFEYLSATLDKKGNIWIATYRDGVWQYDGKNVIHYPIINGDGNVTLFCIYKDRQDNLWLGTNTDGVYKWDGTTFKKFTF